MWLAEELYYRGINNYIQAYMGDTLVWEKLNNDYFYVKPLVGVTNISITLKGYYLDGFENPNRHNWRKRFITQEEAPYLEYSKDKKNWTVWQIEEHPDNANRQRFKPVQVRYGQTLYIRGINPDNSLSTIFEEENTIVVSQLYTDKDVEVGGDIFAVLNYQQSKFSSNRRIGDYGLTEFLSTLNLIYADKLYVDNIKEVGYCGLYFFHSVTYYNNGGDSKLKSTSNIVIDEDTILNEYSLSHLLYGSIVCENYNVILNATTLAPYCYRSLFAANRLMTIAPELPATELVEGCYYELFSGCYALEETPDLPAKVIPSYAYYYMFGSTPLKKFTNNAEEIIGDYSCAYMFSGCSGFTETPTFPKLRYVEGKYGFYTAFSRLPFSRIDLNDMFPSLTTAGVANSVSLFESILSSNPYIEEFVALNITKEPERIYSYTFNACNKLKSITLYATEVSNLSYYGMCYNCKGLEKAPILRAKYVPADAYTYIFQGCSKLNEVYSYAENWIDGSDRGGYNWLNNVAAQGTLYVPAGMVDKYPRGNYGNMQVPEGWTIEEMPDYFYVENTSSMYNSIGFTMRKVKAEYPLADYDDTYVTDLNFSPTLQYSLDGENWNDYTAYLDGNYAEYPKIAVAGKKKIYFRGVSNTNWGKYSNYYWTFPKLTNTLGAKVGGDITTLLDHKTKLTSLPNKCFMRIFSQNANLYSAEKLHFGRVTQFREYTLARMFENCTYLSQPPKINEGYTPYGKGSFAAMFKNCTSLINIPFNEITLANDYAYNDMFYHCTSLNKVPVISATSIGEAAFEGMYQGCTSLRIAPNFDTITTVGKFGCRTMFSGCINLVNVPAILPAMTLSPFAYNYMFSGCSSITKAPDLPALVVPDECYASMFRYCTSLQSFPKMDFTETVKTIGEYDCCTNMFQDCKNAAGRVVLNATKIAGGSYVLMFSGCNKLTEMICYYEDTTDNINAFDRWLQLTAQGTRGKMYVPTGSPLANGGYGIPDNWDIITFDNIEEIP